MKELTRRDLDHPSPDMVYDRNPRELQPLNPAEEGATEVDGFGCQSCGCDKLRVFYKNGGIGLICSLCEKLLARIKVAKS